MDSSARTGASLITSKTYWWVVGEIEII